MLEKLDLDDIPFKPDPSPDSVFQSEQLKEAVRRIQFAVAAKSIIAITGDPGVGKTTVTRHTRDQLVKKKTRVIYTPESTGGAYTAIRSLHYALGIKPPHFRADLCQGFGDACASSDESIVAIVDEAHLMSDEALQQLRILTNRDFDTRPPFVLILVGAPELRDVLARPHLTSLRKRILISYQLEGLAEDEIKLYIDHHLHRAGARRKLFDNAAIREIFGHSRGNPRAINQLALTALIIAVSQDKSTVGVDQIRQAAAELEA